MSADTCQDCHTRDTEIRRLKQEMKNKQQRIENLLDENEKLSKRAIGAEERVNNCIRRYGAGAGM